MPSPRIEAIRKEQRLMDNNNYDIKYPSVTLKHVIRKVRRVQATKPRSSSFSKKQKVEKN